MKERREKGSKTKIMVEQGERKGERKPVDFGGYLGTKVWLRWGEKGSGHLTCMASVLMTSPW